jgi:hypothetical protein
VFVFVDEKPCDIRVAVHGYDHVSVHDRDHDHVATECKAGLIGPEDKGGGSHRISPIPHDSVGLTVALDHPLPNPPPKGEGESIAIS